jgi:hypothetical protein
MKKKVIRRDSDSWTQNFSSLACGLNVGLPACDENDSFHGVPRRLLRKSGC